MRKSTTDEQSPAFQFYANDWISDPNRMKLSLEEQGAYVLLYCHCWRGFKIPKDFEVMSRMLNCRTEKIEKIYLKLNIYLKKKKTRMVSLICIVFKPKKKEKNKQKTDVKDL
jgi:uncharacterized protein YdaU (DUF1376 family)